MAAAAKYHSKQTTQFVQLWEADLANHPALPFSTVSQISRIAEQLGMELRDVLGSKQSPDKQLAGLQSSITKTDMKRGQFERFREMANDDSLAEVAQANDLDPDQLSAQAKIRQSLQDVESKLEEAEKLLEKTRKRLLSPNDDHSSRFEMQELERSLRDVETEIKDRQDNLDELSRRISSIRLPTPPRSERITFGGSPTISLFSQQPQLKVPASIQAEVRAAVDQDPVASWTKRFAVRQTKTTRVGSSKGCINVDDLPAPGQLPKGFKAEPKPSTGTTPFPPSSPTLGAMRQIPAGPVSFPNVNPSSAVHLTGTADADPSPPPSPFSFSGISFSLDPGQITSQPRTHGGSGRASSSNRQHAPAAKISSEGSPIATNTAGGGFSFALPKKEEAADAKPGAGPSGFVSFSGFGKK